MIWWYRSFATTVSKLEILIFQKKVLKILKCHNLLWVQWRHHCSPTASFANCVMTLYLLKVHLQTFISTPVTQKWQILSCDTLVANERYDYIDEYDSSTPLVISIANGLDPEPALSDSDPTIILIYITCRPTCNFLHSLRTILMLSFLVAITNPLGPVINFRGWYTGVCDTEWYPIDWLFWDICCFSEYLSQIVGIISKLGHENLYIQFFEFILDDHKPFIAT
jgi:hypothetical protein